MNQGDDLRKIRRRYAKIPDRAEIASAVRIIQRRTPEILPMMDRVIGSLKTAAVLA
jgi:hypothetical protein